MVKTPTQTFICLLKWQTHERISRKIVGKKLTIKRYQKKMIKKMVGLTGFEPATSRSRTERSTKLSHNPTNKTHDTAH